MIFGLAAIVALVGLWCVLSLVVPIGLTIFFCRGHRSVSKAFFLSVIVSLGIQISAGAAIYVFFLIIKGIV